MAESTEPNWSNPVYPISTESETNLDTAPLELTVTTSITSLTPSDVSTAPSSPSCSTKQSTEDNSTSYDHVEMEPPPPNRLESMQEPKIEQEPKMKPQYHPKPPTDNLMASDTEIKPGARFLSFADFERVFEHWKATNFHPFRVASSETLRMPDGSTNSRFKYRYIVYHCAHYGAPRMRGAGKRPNQNYMPCGCKAMLRLNYSWSENALRVTTLNDEHCGHDVTSVAYYKFAAKAKQRQSSISPPGTPNSVLIQQSAMKRPNSESPINQIRPIKRTKPNASSEAPLNLSKNGNDLDNGNVVTVPATTAHPSSALSVLMFNQQYRQGQHQQQQAYHELVRLLSGGALTNGANGLGLNTAGGGGQDHRTETERNCLMYPIVQTLMQHLTSARGLEFDEKLRDLKGIMKKWQLIPTSSPPTMTNSTRAYRPTSAAAAAAAMMVQAMSAGAGSAQFVTTNGNGK